MSGPTAAIAKSSGQRILAPCPAEIMLDLPGKRWQALTTISWGSVGSAGLSPVLHGEAVISSSMREFIGCGKS